MGTVNEAVASKDAFVILQRRLSQTFWSSCKVRCPESFTARSARALWLHRKRLASPLLNPATNRRSLMKLHRHKSRVR